MTKEKYYEMCKQLPKEPVQSEIPPEVQDFPDEVQTAILVFNKLGDRVFADIGYLGKDYTLLPTYMDVHRIKDRKLFLEVLTRLDSYIIKKSAEKMKTERDKLNKGKKPSKKGS